MNFEELPFTVNRSCSQFAATGSRRIYSQLTLFLIAALAAAFFFGCDAFYSKTSKNTEKSEGEKTMVMLATAEKKAAAIPPIDAAAPIQTETATFALG